MVLFTQHQDNYRTGLYFNESYLKVGNVGGTDPVFKDYKFGKLGDLAVDGSVYAQPLVATGVTDVKVKDDKNVEKEVNTILIVATMHNSVYAFDLTVPTPPAQTIPAGSAVPEAPPTPTFKLLWRRRLITNEGDKGGKAGYSIQLPHWDVGRRPDRPCYGKPFYKDFAWEIGIVSTPVIDTADNSIYVVSTNQSQEPSTQFNNNKASNDKITHTLWKLNLADGTNKGFTQIAASCVPVPPPAATSQNSPNTPVQVSSSQLPDNTIWFDSKRHLQRAALAVYNDISRNKKIVYICFAGYNDMKRWQGWILGYDTAQIKPGTSPTYTFCTEPTPDAYGAGIWQAGQGPAVDGDGNLYVMTGNGEGWGHTNPNAEPGKATYGCSVIKLTKDLRVSSFFTPRDSEWMSAGDIDLGSGGVLLVRRNVASQPLIAIAGGKTNVIYVMSAAQLSKEYKPDNGSTAGVDYVVQAYDVRNAGSQMEPPGVIDHKTHGEWPHHHIHGTPAYYQASNKSQYLYVWPEDMNLQQLWLGADGKLQFAEVSDVNEPEKDYKDETKGMPGGSRGMPGGFMTVSCLKQPAVKGSGIVWANHPWKGNANNAVRPGILHAFDAENIRMPIWSSRRMPKKDIDTETQKKTHIVNVARDDVGNFAKFCCPTVANGHVYQASMGGFQQLDDSQKLLDQKTGCTPAIVGLKDRLLLAWTSKPDGTIKTLLSADDTTTTSGGKTISWSTGLTWHSESAITVTGATSQLPPSLAFDTALGISYLAWTDKLSGTVKISKAGRDGSWSPATDTPTKSLLGPAITFGSILNVGTLFLAWVDEAGLIKVSASTDSGANWKQASKISDASNPPQSRSRPYLAFNPFQHTVVLAWPDKAKGYLNFLEFASLDAITSAQPVTLEKEPPVIDPETKLKGKLMEEFQSPQQPPDRVSPNNYGIAIDFLADGYDKTGKSVIGVPIIAYISEYKNTVSNLAKQSRSFKEWNAINTAVSDDGTLLGLQDFSTRYRMYYDSDIGQKACDGPALAHYSGKVFVAWVFDKTDPTNDGDFDEKKVDSDEFKPKGIVDDYCVNVGVLSRGSVAVYGLKTQPATTTGTKPAGPSQAQTGTGTGTGTGSGSGNPGPAIPQPQPVTKPAASGT